MDTDRPPHRCTSSGGSGSGSGSTTSELFICFTSRLSSSSSMKISSKSILSPGRARDSSQISLSTSLSRRLRNSGSIKGGQASPMFPATNGKKRGCNSFENPEPSSPKVTCIGQVRVKTKKQGKKMRARSKSSRREVSFRKTEQTSDANANGNHFHQFQQQECLPHQRNQRWVHLPVTICEALRAFGAEFNCFLPCRSSCMASDNNNKEERASNGGGGGGETGGTSTSCGAVFARWLLAEKIELVVGDAEERDKEEDDDEEEDDMMPRRSQRRHVFDDIVIEEAESKNEILEVDDEKEEESRVSICVPPKNALLLMRCRSDPVKMAALANRFWECPPPPDEGDEDNQENDNEIGGLVKEESHPGQETEQLQTEDVFCEKLDSFSQIAEEEHQIPEAEVEAEAEAEADVLLDSEEKEDENDNQQVQVRGDSQKQDQEEEEEEEEEVLNQSMLEDETVQSASTETFADLEDEDNVTKSHSENEHVLENEPESAPEQVNEEAFNEESGEDEQELEAIVAEESIETTEEILHEEKEEPEEEEEETVATTTTTHERSEPEEPETIPEPETGQQSKERESQNLLPDCLLLMMCEPKLSMEVSKETWVCSTDFIRWHPSEKKPPALPPQQIVNKTDGCDEPKKRVSIDLPPAPKQQIMQPPRSSCSFPAAPPFVRAHGAQSMNTMVEQKLVGAKHSYEPFSLTRCKSEPLRSSAKLAPDACFWKNRKLEPHRPAATLGVGAAGVGC